MLLHFRPPYMSNTKRIIEFYGTTCPFCARISPEVDRLEADNPVTVERLEVWNTAENAAKMEALKPLYDEHCNGNMIVPSFYDESTNRLICNPGTYEDLKAWVFDV